jgi:peptide/nickel transport system substrate-binding protein
MKNKKSLLLVLALLIGAFVLVACATPDPVTIIETVVVTEIVEGQVVEVVQTQIVEVEVPGGEAPMDAPVDPNPSTWTWVTFGDSDTLDPAWNYESSGNGFIEDIYDTLVTYAGPDATTFVPSLATSWEVSDDGTVYTFYIREGVTFHEGQELTASDVAYSFQRGVLQGGGWSPQWLYTEALFGIGIHDISEIVEIEETGEHAGAYFDDPETIQGLDPAVLLATCERVTNAIVADDAAGTVTFTLAQPWGPLLSTMSGAWGSITDMGWTVEQGAWDGDCATWQNYYGITSESAPLAKIANGTGPYMFDHWTPGEEFVMVANPNYWRDEAAYEGGPTGAARLERVVVLLVDEWGTRFAMLQAGDADTVTVPSLNWAQVDPMVAEICSYVDIGEFDCQATENANGTLRMYRDVPSTSRTDAFFVFDINVEGGNPYIGSGELDGNGIPADFFSDIHVRKAFNYCFDHDAFIAEVLSGEGIQNYGPINQGLIGYDYDAAHYSFDLEACQAEIEQAWGGAVAENGFRMQIGYNTGNVSRQTIAQILQANFGDIDAKYQVEIVGLPWPTFLQGIREARIPIFVSGWGEDIHDPHNWAQPFLVGTYASRQNMPADMMAEFSALVDAGVAGTTDEERAAAYLEIQRLDYEYAPAIRLAVASGRSYQQMWVSEYVINVMLNQPFYYYAK